MDILIDEIRDTVAAMPSSMFSTHELILTLAQRHQRAYIIELYGHRDAVRPFQSVHAKIGKCLRNHPELVSFVPDSEVDEDIFGHPSANARWMKLG